MYIIDPQWDQEEIELGFNSPTKEKKMNDEVMVQLDELARRDLAVTEAMGEANLAADAAEGNVEILGYTQDAEDTEEPTVETGTLH